MLGGERLGVLAGGEKAQVSAAHDHGRPGLGAGAVEHHRALWLPSRGAVGEGGAHRLAADRVGRGDLPVRVQGQEVLGRQRGGHLAYRDAQRRGDRLQHGG